MDPVSALGIAASIAGLLSLAGQIVSAGFALHAKVEKNADEIRAVANEVAALSGVLLGVQSRLPSAGGPLPAGMAKAVGECTGALTEISGLLKKLGESGRLTLVLRGEAREQRLVKLTRRVEHYKTYFILFFQLETTTHLEVVQRRMIGILTAIEALAEGQNRIEQSVNRLVDAGKLEEYERIINWLGSAAEAIHRDLCEQRDPHSAQWIFGQPVFESWLTAENPSFFWLRGTHGSGKSIIVSNIIEVVQEEHLGSDSGLVYHYCRFGTPESLSATHILSSLVVQLLRQSPKPDEALAIIKVLYEKRQRLSSRPRFGELHQAFLDISRSFSKLFILIDGLDEMPDRGAILNFIETLDAGDLPVVFKVLVASRQVVDLGTALALYTKLTVKASNLSQDIEQYVRRKIRHRPSLRSQEEEIVRSLVAGADGMFLWVFHQMEYLQRVQTVITPELLRALPRSLELTYERIFAAMDEYNRKWAKKILLYVMTAVRPLSLGELVEGIAVTTSARSIRDVQLRRFTQPDAVFEICQSLIRQSRNGTIELSHYSVYEFLDSSLLENDRPNDIYVARPKRAVHMLKSCLTYMSFDRDIQPGSAFHTDEESESGDGLDDDLNVNLVVFTESPFLEYSVLNWFRHVSDIPASMLNELWTPHLHPFLMTSKFDSWVQLAHSVGDKYRYPPGLGPLHVCASHGWPQLAQKILADTRYSRSALGADIFATGDRRTPLHFAIENDQNQILDFFITALVADVLNFPDRHGRTPLRIAVEAGNEYAVSRLVTAGADVNFSAGRDRRTPVSIAIENKWEAMAVLLSRQASPEATLADGRTLLHLAAQSGSLLWTSALLARDIGLLNETDDHGWTALHYAADKGDEGVVRYLLERGACPAVTRVRFGWTALHAAVRHRHTGCLEAILRSSNPLLPQNRARARVDEDMLAWWMRADDLDKRDVERKYGRDVIRELKRRAASGSSSDPSMQIVPSPLSIAVADGYLLGVRLMLDHHGPFYQTIGSPDFWIGASLKALVSDPTNVDRVAIFSQLLRRASRPPFADLLSDLMKANSAEAMSLFKRAVEGKGAQQAMLLAAIRASSAPMTALVLDFWPISGQSLPQTILTDIGTSWRETDMRSIDHIVAASRNTTADPGLVLLNTSIKEGNLVSTEYFATHYVTDASHTAPLVHTLLQAAGEDDETTATALRIAQTLVKKGASVDAPGELGRSLCHWAAARADISVLQWALENGASASLQDSNGDNPVQVAVAFEQLLHLELLLQNILEREPAAMVLALCRSGRRRPALIIATDMKNLAVLQSLLEADQEARLLAGSASGDDSLNNRLRRVAYADALCNSVKTHFIDGFSLLLCHIDSISEEGSDGRMPLHVAIREGKAQFVEILLRNGADVGVMSIPDKKKPYGLALDQEAKQPGILDMLIRYGALPEPGDLLEATIQGKVDLVDSILSYYPDDAETQREALYVAREAGKDGIVGLLMHKTGHTLINTVDGIRRDAFGDSALHAAIWNRKADEAASILRSSDQTTRRLLIRSKDLRGHTPLILAIQLREMPCAHAVAMYGADLEAATTWAARSAEGVRQSRVNMVRELVNRHPPSV